MFDSLLARGFLLKKTPALWIGFFGAVLGMVLSLAYARTASWSAPTMGSGFIEVMALGMQGWIILLCTDIVRQETEAGECFHLLCGGGSRIRTFIPLWVLLTSVIGGSVFCASMGFYLLWAKISMMWAFCAVALMLLPLPGLLLFQLWVALRFGSSRSIGVGMVFLLLEALGATGLFDGSWVYVPATWPLRFSSYGVAAFFYPEKRGALFGELHLGILLCVVLTLVLAWGVGRWFCRWDGPRGVSEV